MIKGISKKRLIILLAILVMILLLVIFLVSRAFIAPEIDKPAITNVNISSCAYFNLENEENPISLAESFPMSDNQGLRTTPYTFTLTNTCEAEASFNLYLVVNSDSQITTDKIKVDLSTFTSNVNSPINGLGTATLDAATESEYELKTGNTVKEVYLLQSATLLKDLPVEFDFRMWISEIAGNEVANQTFNASILVADGTSGTILYPSLGNLCEGIEAGSCFEDYQIADNELIAHTSSVENSSGDNELRYSGANPNNYVTFNDEMWRIIGIFDGKLKLIKETSIGTYEFDPEDEENLYGDNSWADDGGGAEFNQLLNNYYFNSTTAPNLLADCGGSSRGSCDFTSTGLDATARAMVETSTWYLGGYNTSEQTANAIYTAERGNSTSSGTHITTEANIGLMYISDYGYAASSNAWTTNLNSYNTNSIPASNWMYSGVTERTISPRLSNSYSVWSVDYNGIASNYIANFGFAVRPTLYLKSSVEIAGGTGTESDPFTLYYPTAANYLVKNHDAGEGLYQHTADLANGAGDNNYRYSGPDSLVKNYVTYNDEMWRIIGVFDGNVKLIKETSIGIYEFDPGNDNSWADDGGGAELNQLLNSYYYNSTVAPNLLADCGGSERGSCDFTTTGLDATSRTMVETSTWYLGAPDSSFQTANAFYNEERGNSTSPGTHITTQANIGLMYLSDYGYAATSNAWTTDLYDYDTNSISASNWMYSGVIEWAISPYLPVSSQVWLVNDSGFVNGYLSSDGLAWRPVLHLKSNTKIVGGTGTESDPFQLGL